MHTCWHTVCVVACSLHRTAAAVRHVFVSASGVCKQPKPWPSACGVRMCRVSCLCTQACVAVCWPSVEASVCEGERGSTWHQCECIHTYMRSFKQDTSFNRGLVVPVCAQMSVERSVQSAQACAALSVSLIGGAVTNVHGMNMAPFRHPCTTWHLAAELHVGRGVCLSFGVAVFM